MAFSSFHVEHYQGIIGAVYVGIFEMGITFVLWLKALKLSSNTAKISNLIFISPFFSLIFISIFVGETIHGYTLVGLAFILIGLAIQLDNKKPTL